MANSSNAYATVKPLENTVSDWLSNQEQTDFAYRQEQRQIEQLEQQRKDKEQAKKDKLREKMLGQIPKNYDTGSSSLNELQGKIIQKGVNRLGEIYRLLSNQNLSEDERVKLEIEAQNIDNLPENLKIATDNYSAMLNDYKKGVANGSYFPDANFEKLALSGFENYFGDLDNGLPYIGLADRNNDGKIDKLDIVSYDQLQQGIGNWTFQKQYDLDKMAVDAAKNIGYEDITTDRNFRSVQEKKAKISDIESVANNLLQNPDGSPTDATLSQLRKMGLQQTPESVKKVKQYFMERVLANTDYTKKENTDWSAINTASENKRKAAKENIQKIQATFDDQLRTDDFTNKRIASNVVLPNMITIQDNKIKFKNLGGEKSKLNNGYITGFALQNDGKIVVTGKALIDKGKKFKVGGYGYNGNEESQLALDSYNTPENYGRFVRELSGPELSGFIRTAGYSSVNELKSELKQMNNNRTDEKPSASKYGL